MKCCTNGCGARPDGHSPWRVSPGGEWRPRADFPPDFALPELDRIAQMAAPLLPGPPGQWQEISDLAASLRAAHSPATASASLFRRTNAELSGHLANTLAGRYDALAGPGQERQRESASASSSNSPGAIRSRRPSEPPRNSNARACARMNNRPW